LNTRSVRVGIVGTGNCASSFVQGLTYYQSANDGDDVPGLMNPSIGRYRVRDVEVASAFDVHAGKVGRDLSEALACTPNNARVCTPLSMDLKLEVWDSPNSAGIVIDAVCCAKLAIERGIERGIGGAIIGPSSYFMKSPPQQFHDHVARELTLEFIRQPRTATAPRRAPERNLPDHDYAIPLRAARHVRAD